MNYHNISYPDQNNGDGLRVVLWLSGCSHHCKGCQNTQTWDINSGIPFDEEAKEEIFRELRHDYISGITFSGGDPLHENNLDEILKLTSEIRSRFPDKTIWLYTGYEWEELTQNLPRLHMLDYLLLEEYEDKNRFSDEEYRAWQRFNILKYVDVLVDGRYVDELRDISLHWRGSSNQRVINVQKSLKKGEIVLWSS